MKQSIWIFGYGSILWRPDFQFTQAIPVRLTGFKRRLVQGSTDHRGSSVLAGVVASLRPDPNAETTGIAYLLEGVEMKQTLQKLDHREKNGYEQTTVTVSLGSQTTLTASTYIAPAGNPWDLGALSDHQIADRILNAAGPSGSNADYFLRLYAASLALCAPDPYLQSLYERIERRLSETQRDALASLQTDPALIPCGIERSSIP